MMEPTDRENYPGDPVADGDGVPSGPAPLFISPGRIVFMSLLSFGLYPLYWLYKTWRHYRDHTGETVYPVWHGLTQFIPVYGSFRAHSHFRQFGELAGRAGLNLGIMPGLAFAIVLAGWFLGLMAGGISSPEIVEVVDAAGNQVVDPETGQGEFEIIEPTQSELMTSLVIRLVNIGLGIWMIMHAQLRINYYWHSVFGHRLVGMPMGKGEILALVIGVFLWFATISGIMSA